MQRIISIIWYAYLTNQSYPRFLFQMFPVGLLNSIHRALEPHNDQVKGFTLIKSLVFIRIKSTESRKTVMMLWTLRKKWFILEVHNKNREYRETNFTWADFWYKLIILTKNKRWQSVSDSVTKIPSPTLCHRNLVWEPKMGWGVFHRERLHVFVC